MERRTFLQSLAATGAGLALNPTSSSAADSQAVGASVPFAVDEHRIRFFMPEQSRTTHVHILADTHLFTDDERGVPFQRYSARMARGYNRTQHFQTGKPTNPEECFQESLQRANDENVDLLALVGDIVSFPSEAAIDWALQQLSQINVPWTYVAGNHDWHYEGMEGSLTQLRDTWIERRLKPLYQDEHPLMSCRTINGIRFLSIDNSHYQIQPGQLEFLRKHVASQAPLVLLVHIPLYAPGRPIGFGCGHPQWGAAIDPSWELERRERWPDQGHTSSTMQFHQEVFQAPNMLAVFAGHIHRQSVDVLNGTPQFVTRHNATSAYLDVKFEPAPSV